MNNLVHFDTQGLAHISNQGIIELAYQDKLDDSVFEWQDQHSKQKFEEVCNYLDHRPFAVDALSAFNRDWFTPAEFQNIDLDSYVLACCKNQQQQQRAIQELELIHKMGAESIFLHLIYLVNLWRSQNLVWGIGRGSSVSCFVLYAIGLNKINPLDYDLDHKEFFKTA